VNVLLLAIPTGAALIGAAISPWGWAGAFAGTTGLALLAGTRLQREKDARQSAQFTVDTWFEFVGDAHQREGRSLESRTIVGLAVRAPQRGGEFSVHCSNLRGAEREWPRQALDGYDTYLAWERTSERTNTIGYRGVERVLMMWSYLRPQVFSFLVPQTAAYSPGDISVGWLLRPVGDWVKFDVRVVNETAEVAIERTITVSFRVDGMVDSVDSEPVSAVPTGTVTQP
jgi:hypothetical protein